MSTGGIALLLAVTPHTFPGLITIGTIVFIFDVTLFVLLTALILARFIIFPGTFTQSVYHPTESLFIPTFFLTLSTIISCIQKYGYPSTGPWLVVTLRILFWTYVAITFTTAVLQYHLLFTGKPITLQSMTPAWILPVFPIMLSGTVASVISASQPQHQAIPILIAGTTFQGLGILISVFMYSNYMGRLMSNGLPSPDTRPGMFISVGPPSFTGLAFIGMANAAIEVFPHTFVLGTAAVPTAQVLKIVAVFLAIVLWSLSLFFFCISLLATLNGMKKMSFHLTWWSFVFPNTGFIIAIIDIGTAINSQSILWISSVATVLQVVMWLLVFVAHARAIVKKQILWPGKGA
ncbi:MAG: hypothetical protein Q9175_000969 [Cornicularia normoerica]